MHTVCVQDKQREALSPSISYTEARKELRRRKVSLLFMSMYAQVIRTLMPYVKLCVATKLSLF